MYPDRDCPRCKGQGTLEFCGEDVWVCPCGYEYDAWRNDS